MGTRDPLRMTRRPITFRNRRGGNKLDYRHAIEEASSALPTS